MTATRSEFLHQPLWVSALLASASPVAAEPKLRHRVGWDSGRASLHFINDGRAPVFIAALAVELSAGSTVDVRWPAGATGYELKVHRAPGRCNSRVSPAPRWSAPNLET